MSVKGGPGQGTTLALSIDETLSRLRTIQLPEWIASEVDFTGLSDLEWFCFLNANLKDGGQFVAEMYHNTEIAEPTVNVVQIATITFPIQTAGNGAAAVLAGSGFITGLGFPNAAVGEPMIQRLTFKFDGFGTKPLYTPEAASVQAAEAKLAEKLQRIENAIKNAGKDPAKVMPEIGLGV